MSQAGFVSRGETAHDFQSQGLAVGTCAHSSDESVLELTGAGQYWQGRCRVSSVSSVL